MNGVEIIVGQVAFEGRFGNLYRSLYVDDEPFKASFCHSSWKFVLCTKSFEWNEKKFQGLCDAVAAVGDSEMVWTNLEFAPRHSVSCVIPLEYRTYVEAMRNDDLGWLYAGRKAIFGLSGLWAGIVDEVTYFAGGFALFGGTTPFIDELVRTSGGMERMRQDFVTLMDDPTAAVPSDLRERLLAEVGWD